MIEFTSLPIAVGCNIINDWIKLKDLVRLDSAYCNHSTRSSFLSYCQSGTLEKDEIELLSLDQIQWFVTRKWKFRKLSIYSLNWQEGIVKALSELLAYVGGNIKELTICPDSSLSDLQLVCFNTIIAQNCRNIQKVNITTRSTDMELAPLFFLLKSVREWDISHCNITSASLYIIANMCAMNLKILFLRSVDVYDAGLTVLAGKCPELEELSILHCDRVTAMGVVALVKTTPKLTVLEITMSDLTDIDITTIAQHCPMLYSLGMDAQLLTDAGIQAIVSSCTQLRIIDFDNGINISTGFSLFRNLEELRLSNCLSLTNEMVASIVQNNPFLKYLELYYCTQLTAAAVLTILHGCSELHSLIVDNTVSTTTTRNTALLKALIKQLYPNIILALINLA